MLAIYETVNRRLTRADEIEEGTWICLTAPSQEEIREVAATLDIEPADVQAALAIRRSSCWYIVAARYRIWYTKRIFFLVEKPRTRQEAKSDNTGVSTEQTVVMVVWVNRIPRGMVVYTPSAAPSASKER